MDLKVVDSGNGGNLELNANDLKMIGGFQTMIYLAMFGGNPGFPTEGIQDKNKQFFDWWGNNQLFENDKTIQFNSYTEQALLDYPLTSFGRIQIENAVKTDLSFMSEFADVRPTVYLEGVDKCRIEIIVIEPNGLTSNVFNYIWDNTEQELKIEQ